MLEQEFEGMMSAAGLADLDREGTQWVQMRRAFFGGAAITFLIVNQGSELENEDDAIRVLEGVQNELDHFTLMLEQGKA